MERGRRHESYVGGKGDLWYYNVVPQNLKEGDHFDIVGIGERKMLQQILKK